MKRKNISLNYGLRSRAESVSPLIVSSIPGDIRGCNPKQGFSRSWTCDTKRRHLVHLRLRHYEKRLRALRSRRLHPHGVCLRSVRCSFRIGQWRCSAIPMVFGVLRFRTRPCLLQLPPLLALARALPFP